jgi:hypothetical protein
MVRPRVLSPVAEETATTAEALLAEARTHLDEKRYEEALRRLRAARSLEPDNADVIKAVRQAETEIRAYLEIDGVDVAGVPVLAKPLAELATQSFTPEAGFILSRITGESDLASILKISPLAEMDALLVVWKLLKAGHIELKFE